MVKLQLIFLCFAGKYNYVKLNEDDSDRAPLWQIFAAAFGACTTMLFFAYFQGIIRLN